MKESDMPKHYKKPLTAEQLAALKDSEIDTTGIPELDDEFWARAEVRPPVSKSAISIRLDDDVLEWFKAQGKGYQSRINAVLRAYKDAHQSG